MDSIEYSSLGKFDSISYIFIIYLSDLRDLISTDFNIKLYGFNYLPITRYKWKNSLLKLENTLVYTRDKGNIDL